MKPHVEEIYLREIVIQCRYAQDGVAKMNELLRTEVVEVFFRETQEPAERTFVWFWG